MKMSNNSSYYVFYLRYLQNVYSTFITYVNVTFLKRFQIRIFKNFNKTLRDCLENTFELNVDQTLNHNV